MAVITRSKSRKKRRRKISDSRAERAATDGATALAAEKERLAVVTKLIAEGRFARRLYYTDRPTAIAWEKAALAGDMKRIVEGTVNTTVTTDGRTPLYLAAQNSHLTVVTTLIAAGADVDAATTTGATPLFIAAGSYHFAVVCHLIAAGADVNKGLTNAGWGCTPLYIAAQEGCTAIVSKLLEHGADKSIRGWQKETPLEAAQRMNHGDIVAILA